MPSMDSKIYKMHEHLESCRFVAADIKIWSVIYCGGHNAPILMTTAVLLTPTQFAHGAENIPLTSMPL